MPENAMIDPEEFRRRCDEQLRQLRLKAAELPAEQQPFFFAAIEEAERQQQRLDKANGEIRSLVQDLSLIVATTQFNTWAAGLIP
jgi:hypothetical protein